MPRTLALALLGASLLATLPLPGFAQTATTAAPADLIAPLVRGPMSGALAAARASENWQEHDGHTISVADLETFYAPAGHTPQWTDAARLSALVSELETLADDGLLPADYALDALRNARDQGSSADATQAACTDLLASRAYLQALMHLRYGRLDPAKAEKFFVADESGYYPDRMAIVRLGLEHLADPQAAFAAARPQHHAYTTLRSAYARLRKQFEVQAKVPRVPAGPPLSAGMRDQRTPILRDRLMQFGYTGTAPTTNTDPRVVDEPLVEAIARFQREHGLKADGVAGRGTLAALNATQADRRSQLLVNLERQRWIGAHLASMGNEYLLVDIAGAITTYVRDGNTAWEGRSAIGRPARATPQVRSVITHFDVNPTWTIPPTILRQDKLPIIRRDPGYLARNRMRVFNSAGQQVSPGAVNWNNPGSYSIRQDAGPGNALGRVILRFPNPFAVFLHDTPSQGVFARDNRSVSSGCVRVEGAPSLVEELLVQGGMAREKVQAALAGKRTQRLNLANPVPLLMAYWTADVSPSGRIDYRNDVYDLDAKLLRALRAPRPLADACAHPPAPLPAPAAAPMVPRPAPQAPRAAPTSAHLPDHGNFMPSPADTPGGAPPETLPAFGGGNN